MANKPLKSIKFPGLTDTYEVVQSDWSQNDENEPSYVKNRPFYTGDTIQSELIPEQTVTFTENDGVYDALSPVNVDMVEGQTYTVNFDGQAYECVCKSFYDVKYIGCATGFGLEDTGEPFLYATTGGQYLWMAINGGTEHTLSILTLETPIVKIPDKYLPKATTDEYGVLQTPIVYIPSYSTFTATEMEEMYEKMQNDNGPLFVIVYFDSSEKTHCFGYGIILQIADTSGNGNYTVYLHDGRYYYMTKGEDGLYSFPSKINPLDQFDTRILRFLGTDGNSRGHFYVNNNSTESRVIFSNNFEVSGTLMAKSFILSSSTENSNKKFQITVDDTGTISATEVT